MKIEKVAWAPIMPRKERGMVEKLWPGKGGEWIWLRVGLADAPAALLRRTSKSLEWALVDSRLVSPEDLRADQDAGKAGELREVDIEIAPLTERNQIDRKNIKGPM